MRLSGHVVLCYLEEHGWEGPQRWPRLRGIRKVYHVMPHGSASQSEVQDANTSAGHWKWLAGLSRFYLDSNSFLTCEATLVLNLKRLATSIAMVSPTETTKMAFEIGKGPPILDFLSLSQDIWDLIYPGSM